MRFDQYKPKRRMCLMQMDTINDVQSKPFIQAYVCGDMALFAGK